jgi:glycosyltransferase involved in cell wall biosynthesis
MDPQPLVTIVTPSYNQAGFLRDTLRSVLAQDYPVIEYLVIDGGSDDGSVEIIQEYAPQLAWWVSEKDEGQADAINKGMARARGEIVAWLNSDDIYLPGAVSQAVKAFQANPEVGLVFGDAITIDASGRPLNSLLFRNWGLVNLLAFRIICQPAVFLRRRVYQQSGGLNKNYHYMLDHFLWIRSARLAPIQHIPHLWAAARHHASAKNVSQAPGFGAETLRLLDWIKSQPDLAELFEHNRHKIEAGAYRLNARYLLDGGQPGAALKSYWRAFQEDPGYTSRHWHRILYAILSLLGAQATARWYTRYQESRRPVLLDPSLQGWPGLTLEGDR